MPLTADGRFRPSPWTPFSGDRTLFDVIPPGHPDEEAPATAADRLWYATLVKVTGRTVHHIVTEVGRNHRDHRGVKFSGTALGILKGYQRVISMDLLDGEPSPTVVGSHLSRLVKTFRLVVHDPAPGPRHNWPMAPRRVDLDDAMQVVGDAFWGRWPTDAIRPDPPVGPRP